ncbi:hypothetical protein [Microbacterium sp. CFBP9034]|uniref:hypothetical protein n=1 Tax=Microbacterium sp. CFBP9034 TaxID=3096540 RepID=UPI002A6B82AB|nr:hypothetical protein [Microbacterium sp. CFBP9034]MDY0910900.1 hypothetical protein [Microbacterium sp. CFBP9034]
MNKTRLASVAVLLLLLTGCASPAADEAGTGNSGSTTEQEAEETQAPPAEPLDLAGEWKQTNSKSTDAYQAAIITGDEIVVNWVNDTEDTTALYWAGTYVAPTEDVDTYTWNSANDTARTESAILASSDPTKTFTYEGGVLKYELTAMGVTMTVEMAQQ